MTKYLTNALLMALFGVGLCGCGDYSDADKDPPPISIQLEDIQAETKEIALTQE